MFKMWLCTLGVILFSLTTNAGQVKISGNQLLVDGQAQPQLFGAEVQYFRLRGGLQRNIPRDQVIALWNKTLDQLVAAHANAISFYIPWDFHEYAPGKFDFDGLVDEDGDGRPDYPSRDLKTWLKLVEAHGIRHILVRPGPHINAEWGFLGFGAIPLWFHRKFPDSHMRNSLGQRTRLYSYEDRDFLRASKAWLSALYKQVLQPYIGPGRPIDFVQIDNESNFMWQSIFNNDYGKRAVRHYQAFLRETYGDLGRLNSAHQRTWKSFAQILPPINPGQNLAEDQDWYRFHDHVIHAFLRQIRRHWERLGVREPAVLFTLAESYNAANHGLLPNYKLRNDRGQTGMMAVNLYPKNHDGPDHVLLNQPFKADHDIKAADSASDYYLGSRQEWVMGPELQGGWWPGASLSPEARQQTYLSALGHGLKAFFIYYFNEGQNWQNDWIAKQTRPYYFRLKADPRYRQISFADLPAAFWKEVNDRFAAEVLAGFDLRWAIFGTHTSDLDFNAPIDGNLHFDAPIDRHGERRAPFQRLADVGAKIVAPYGAFLGSAVEMTDPVCFLKDTASNVPTDMKGVDSATMNSTWAAGLIGYLLQAGINPKILHWGLSGDAELKSCRLLIYQDNGTGSPELAAQLKSFVAAGGGLLNLLGQRMAIEIEPQAFGRCSPLGHAGSPASGVACSLNGGWLFQVDQPFYTQFNSDDYPKLTDVPARRELIEQVLSILDLHPRLYLKGGGDRVVAFGREGADGKQIYITVKSGRLEPVRESVVWTEANPKGKYRIKRLMTGEQSIVEGAQMVRDGFAVDLRANGSDAFFVEAIAP